MRVGISRGVPRFGAAGKGYRLYRKLAPGPWFSSIPDPVAWEARYRDEVLDRLDPQQVAEEIMRLAGGKVPVLCCFEKVGGPIWCHRSLTAAWLSKGLGIMVPELGYEDLQQALHPLRPPA